MEEHETKAKHNIAETCAASISVDDLQNLADNRSVPILDLSRKLVYGEIRGSDRLRSNLAGLYSAKVANPLPKENILITNGAIAANFLVFYTFLQQGDHVICHYPTYQQLYSVPASLGAEVSLWKTKPENGWRLDAEELEKLIKPNTKLIIIK
jgi:aspartate/methionine/tyrosine aminotransferase